MKTLYFLFVFLFITGFFVSAQEPAPQDTEQPKTSQRKSEENQNDNRSANEENQQQGIDETQLLITDSDEEAQTIQPENRNLNAFGAWDFIRMLLILGAVIAVIYLVFFLLKRSANPRLQNNELFKVLSSQMLSNNRSLHLVEVGRQLFLIGAADGSVNLVSEITDKETIDELRLKMSEERAGEKKRFKEALAVLFQNGAEKSNIYPLEMDKSANYIKQQRERLKNL